MELNNGAWKEIETIEIDPNDEEKEFAVENKEEEKDKDKDKTNGNIPSEANGTSNATSNGESKDLNESSTSSKVWFFLFNLINNANNGFKGGAIYKRLFCNNVSYQDMI